MCIALDKRHIPSFGVDLVVMIHKEIGLHFMRALATVGDVISSTV